MIQNNTLLKLKNMKSFCWIYLFFLMVPKCVTFFLRRYLASIPVTGYAPVQAFNITNKSLFCEYFKFRDNIHVIFSLHPKTEVPKHSHDFVACSFCWISLSAELNTEQFPVDIYVHIVYSLLNSGHIKHRVVQKFHL